MTYRRVNRLTILKILTIIAPAVLVWIVEQVRHTLIVEPYPMGIGNMIIVAIILIGSFFLSRYVFGIIETTQQENLRRNRELAALNSLALATSESLKLDIVLYRSLEQVLQVSPANAGEIWLLEEETQDLVRRTHAGDIDEKTSLRTGGSVGLAVAQAAAKSMEAIVAPDITNSPEFIEDTEMEGKYLSLVSVPLISKNIVVGVLNAFGLEPGQFTSEDTQLIANMANHIALAVENALLYDKVLMSATVEERERIAKDMHDGLAQVLSYVGVKSQAARQFMSSGKPVEAKEQLVELEDAAQGMYTDVRETILNLRTTTSPRRDIASALQEYVTRFSQANGIRTDLRIRNGDISTLSPAVEVQVIRIIQEALTNVRKHAQASHVLVQIHTENSCCNIVIKDDGQGFNSSTRSKGSQPHFGFQMMKERAESIGGTLDIRSSPDSGTEVTLGFPIH
jgi:signal transduction histidine kinase